MNLLKLSRRCVALKYLDTFPFFSYIFENILHLCSKIEANNSQLEESYCILGDPMLSKM